ncbi:hypothetical protein JCM6882_009719 [Rhodosporidiobolus microsporus]
MSTSASGKCCVCGVATDQRCSACGAADFDLFFCSREHQKLVYFVHKQVCGVNAKPFRFPPLSEEEASKAKSLASAPQISFETIEEYVVKVQGGTKDQVPVVIDTLQQPNPPHISPHLTASLVCTIRHKVDRFMQQSVAAGLMSALVHQENCSHPPVVLANVAASISHVANFPVDEDWFIQLMHHVAIFAAICRLCVEDSKRGLRPPFAVGRFIPSTSEFLLDDLRAANRRDKELGKALRRDYEGLFAGGNRDTYPVGGEFGRNVQSVTGLAPDH